MNSPAGPSHGQYYYLQYPLGYCGERMEGNQPPHCVLIAIGLAVLIGTIIVGYGNFLKADASAVH